MNHRSLTKMLAILLIVGCIPIVFLEMLVKKPKVAIKETGRFIYLILFFQKQSGNRQKQKKEEFTGVPV